MDGAIFEKYVINGAIVHTVTPALGFGGAGIAGAEVAATVGSGEGTGVWVDKGVAVGIFCVGSGFNVAGGIRVRVDGASAAQA